MRVIAREILRSSGALVREHRHRWQFVGLVVIAASIPVTELLVAKLFSHLIVGGTRDMSQLVLAFGLFFALFVGTRIANYVQKTYRVTFFRKTLPTEGRTVAPQAESWNWALGLEVITLLSFLVQLIVISVFFIAIDPLFGLANAVLILILLEILGRLLDRQLRVQRDFVAQRKQRKKVSPAERLGARIQSAELGSLIASIGTALMLGVLLLLRLDGQVGVGDTIVLFLGMRLQNTTFATISSSLMRFARAKANSGEPDEDD